MMSRKDAGKSLIEFTNDVGIPDHLITNGVTEFTGKGTEFLKEAHHMCIHLHTTKQGQKNQNHAAEREIGSYVWQRRMCQSTFGILDLCMKLRSC